MYKCWITLIIILHMKGFFNSSKLLCLSKSLKIGIWNNKTWRERSINYWKLVIIITCLQKNNSAFKYTRQHGNIEVDGNILYGKYYDSLSKISRSGKLNWILFDLRSYKFINTIKSPYDRLENIRYVNFVPSANNYQGIVHILIILLMVIWVTSMLGL